MLHLRSSSKTSLERIVDALNPYTASPNIRLILDMIAYKSGIVGVYTSSGFGDTRIQK